MNTFQLVNHFLLWVFLGCGTLGFAQSSAVNDIADEISSHIRNGNVKELSQHFSSTVHMNILGQEGAYSKVQAELVLREFFQKNKPENVKTHQRLQTKTSYRFVVLEMITAKNSFRVSYKLVGVDQSYKISELRVEPSK
jgi:hypothetical protein